jgi:predicted ferric reductase
MARPLRSRAIGLAGPLLAILYIAALDAPLGLAAFGGIESAGMWSETATGFGLIAGVMLMLQLVTSGRFETLSGRIGIDVTIAFHKWAARSLVIVVVLHPLLFLFPVDVYGPGPALHRLFAMVMSPRYLTGVLALLVIGTIVLFAIYRDALPIPYEAWRASHGVMALVAIGLTIDHLSRVGTYSRTWPLSAFWPALALATIATALMVYTFRARRMCNESWRVTSKRHIARDLWELKIGSKGVSKLDFRAGQFAWVAFAPRRFPLFDHPFSIASSPLDGNEVSFIIKESGDFTKRVDAIAIGTEVGIDAPHGCFVLDDLDSESVLLLAGGVGVAPVVGILRDLAARGDRRPIRLLYAGRAAATMIDPREIDAIARGLDFRAIYLVEVADGNPCYEIGVLSADHLTAMLQDFDPEKTAAMICGPSSMMASAADALYHRGVPLGRIRYERFDYASGSLSVRDRRVLLGFWVMAGAVAASVGAFAWR